MTGRLRAAGVLAACLGLSSCATVPTVPAPEVPAPRVWKIPAGFKVVGYFPGWSGEPAETRLEALTHVNYAFALADPSGTYRPLDHPEKLRDLVFRARQAGIKVLLSVGGWNEGSTSAFDRISSNPVLVRRFVGETVRFLYQWALDGVDLDWEYPRAGTAAGYEALVRALAEALHPLGWTVSLAVSAADVNGRHVSDAAWEAADWLNVMAYDDGWRKPRGTPHTSFAFSQEALDYWLGVRKVPREKVVLGVPFYGRHLETGAARSYGSLVREAGGAQSGDRLGDWAFDGPQTLRAKVTDLALPRAGGVMVWQLNQDAPGPDSLLSVIYDAVKVPGP